MKYNGYYTNFDASNHGVSPYMEQGVLSFGTA